MYEAWKPFNIERKWVSQTDVFSTRDGWAYLYPYDKVWYHRNVCSLQHTVLLDASVLTKHNFTQHPFVSKQRGTLLVFPLPLFLLAGHFFCSMGSFFCPSGCFFCPAVSCLCAGCAGAAPLRVRFLISGFCVGRCTDLTSRRHAWPYLLSRTIVVLYSLALDSYDSSPVI